MKKNILLLLAFCCGMNFSQAQNNFISDHLAKYENDSNFDHINVSSKTFELFNEIEAKNANEQSVLGAIAKLDGIKVLFQENTDQAKALSEEAKSKARGDSNYEDLIRVETSTENFLFMVREESDVIKELTVIAGDHQDFMVGTLFGEIDLQSISKLTSVIKENGKEWFAVFENIANEAIDFNGAENRNQNANKTGEDIAINIFPNPVDSYVQLEAIDKSNATYELEFFNSIGVSVKKVGTVSLPYRIELADLPTGAYFLRLTNANGTFKNYRIVKP